MSILRQAGLVSASKQGRWMHYGLPPKNAPQKVRRAIQWLISDLEDDPQIKQDKTRLQKLLKIDKEALCRKQRS
jgi:hypothetical protein